MTKIADTRRARCRSCGAEIVWVTTEAGKPMPLDPDPTPDGNMVEDPTRPRGGPFVHSVVAQRELGDASDPDRYLSHFVTCPNADQHRSGR